jgi:hypothetical protein
MLPSGTAARLKNGSCKMMTISNALERQSPRNLFTILPQASMSPCIGKVSSSPDLSGIFLIALNSRVY